jgi:hypothetical protein
MEKELILEVVNLAKKYNLEIVIPQGVDVEIDFININLKTKQVLFDELDINEKIDS